MLDESDVSLRQLASVEDVHYSLTSLHRFFAGRALPPRQFVELLGSRYGRDDAARERLMLLYERAAAPASASAEPPETDGHGEPETGTEQVPEPEIQPETGPVQPPAPPEPETEPVPPSPATTSRRRLLIPGALVLAGTLAGAGVAVGAGLLGGSSGDGAGDDSPDTELLRNGGFDSGGAHPWWPHGKVHVRTQQGALRIGVSGGTPNPWNAMVGHSGVALREGVSYALRFTAWASVAADMLVTVVREKPPPIEDVRTWPVHLGTAPQEFSFGFESILTSDFGQVTFRFGGGKESFTAFLDDVSLTPVRSQPR